MRSAFIDTLEGLCRSDRNIFLLSADLGFKLFDNFEKNHPDRFLNMGIAEANMVGTAAGLALSGKKVYCYSIIPFFIMRCFELIRISLSYHNLNVRLVGVGSGLSYGLEGMTHHAIEDVAIMKALPNMTIIAPGDPYEASECIKASVNHKGPIFIRLGRNGEPVVHDNRPRFEIGRGIVIFDKGGDVCILATGTMLCKAQLAAEILLQKGLGVTLASIHTIKPLDEPLVRDCAARCKSIFSIEDHSINGGLGSAVAEVLQAASFKGIFKKIGLPQEFCRFIGDREYLYQAYGLVPEKMVDTMIKSIGEGRR